MSSLTSDQVALQLEVLDGWGSDDGCLTKSYQFDDFGSAIGFMTQVAFYAQQLEHYPIWENYFNNVKVRIGSFDSGIQGRDIQLAKRMESVFERFKTVLPTA